MDYKIHNDEMLSIVSEESLEGKSNGTKMYPKEFQCLSNGTSLCFLWNYNVFVMEVHSVSNKKRTLIKTSRDSQVYISNFGNLTFL